MRLLFAAAFLAVFSTGAYAAMVGYRLQDALAFSVDSRCARANDKLGCTCAVQNGGGVDTNGRWWSRRGRGSQANEAFVQCQIKAGRR